MCALLLSLSSSTLISAKRLGSCSGPCSSTCTLESCEFHGGFCAYYGNGLCHRCGCDLCAEQCGKVADARKGDESFDCTSKSDRDECAELGRVCCLDPNGEGDAKCLPEGAKECPFLVDMKLPDNACKDEACWKDACSELNKVSSGAFECRLQGSSCTCFTACVNGGSPCHSCDDLPPLVPLGCPTVQVGDSRQEYGEQFQCAFDFERTVVAQGVSTKPCQNWHNPELIAAVM